MSNPADNTPTCDTCGLALQVRGCTPERCSLPDRCARPITRACDEQRGWVGHDPASSDFEHAFVEPTRTAPPVQVIPAGGDGGDGFAVVHKPIRPDATFVANPGDFFNGHPLSSFCETCRLGILEIGRTERLEVTLCAACTAMMARSAPPPPKTETGARVAAADHPLPWRWVAQLGRRGGYVLFDADGHQLLFDMPEEANRIARDVADTLGMAAKDVPPASPYVRAVTERAKALDKALRWALSWLDDFVDFDDHESEQRMKATAARKLLAEIDSTKGGR